MNPLVSVLIPIYNAGTGIEKTLHSLKEQTYQNFEVIVVNDGSTDNSVDIVQSIYPQARIIHQKNTGITGALNHGIQYCQGDFIARVDSDDIALPKRFELQVDLLNTNPKVGAVGGHIILYEQDGKDLGVCKYPVKEIDIEEELLSGNVPISHTAAMIRKTVLSSIGGYDPFYNRREDFELWCRISMVSQIANLDQPIMRVLSTRKGISYNAVYYSPLMQLALIERKERYEKGLTWKNEALRLHYQKIIQEKQEKGLTRHGKRRMEALFFIKRAGFLLKSGNRGAALKEYLNAVHSDWTFLKSWLGVISSLFIPTSLHVGLVRFTKKMKRRFRG